MVREAKTDLGAEVTIIAGLKELALAADSGPWYLEDHETALLVNRPVIAKLDKLVVQRRKSKKKLAWTSPNAAFIAAANPTTILKLIAALEKSD